MREISNNTFNNLMEQYEAKENFEQFIIEGCLLDNYILTAKNCKTTIVREKYLNEWSSCYEIIMYNRMPKKYQKIIDLLENEQEQEARKLFFAR